MSARPRPVTATFKPRSMEPPVRPRHYSLSSGESTNSLLSVLKHSSCEQFDRSSSLFPSSVQSLTPSSVQSHGQEKHLECAYSPTRKKPALSEKKDSVSSSSEPSLQTVDSTRSVSDLSLKSPDPSRVISASSLKNQCCPYDSHETAGTVSDLPLKRCHAPAKSHDHRLPLRRSHRVLFKKRGSTESLVSVLDHDSCKELELSDSESELKAAPHTTHQTEPIKKKRYRRHTHESVENGIRRHKVCKDTEQSHNKQPPTQSRRKSETEEASVTYIVDSSEQDGRLTPWEQWLLRKAKADQERVQKELEKKRKEMEEKRRQEQEKRAKEQKAKVKYEEWLQQRVDQLSVKAKQQKKVEKRKSKLKDEEKKRVEEKSEKKYDEWLSQKKNKEKLQTQKEKEEKERKEKEKEELKAKCDQAYSDWLNKVTNRPKSAANHTSFGYASGKLTGYYDTSAHPVPSYYNPLPWQPVEIPRPKSEKRRPAKSNKKWNPNKYL